MVPLDKSERVNWLAGGVVVAVQELPPSVDLNRPLPVAA
jgi:hypothetical protein